MKAIVMEGKTPPQITRRAGRPVLYPFLELKIGESFLVRTAGLSPIQFRRKFDNVRKRAYRIKDLHERVFTVSPVSPETGIRVRRDS